MTRAFFVTAAGLVLSLLAIANLAGRHADDPPKTQPGKSKPLTKEQQEKLKERDRLKAGAEVLRKEEKLAEAIAACEKQLAIEREVWGDLHDVVVASLNQLADLHQHHEDWPAAKKHFEQVLQIQTKRFGEQDWRTGDVRRTITTIERLARMSAEERQKLREAVSLNSQVIALYRQEKYREACDLCRRAVESYRRLLGDNHPDTATNVGNLGHLLMHLGDYQGAAPYLKQALAIREQLLEPEHPSIIESLNNLGALRQHQRDLIEARRLYEQALAITIKAWGPDHYETTDILLNLGTVFEWLADFRSAMDCFQKALAIRARESGENHSETGTATLALGCLLREQGDYGRARLHIEKALTIHVEAHGKQSPVTANSIDALGSLLRAQHDHAMAKQRFEEAIKIFKQTLGPRHPRTANSMESLGLALWAQKDFANARSYFEEVLVIRQKAFGSDSMPVATALNNLALVAKAQGSYETAQQYLEKTLTIYKKSLGPDHPFVALCLDNLGSLLLTRGDHTCARFRYSQAREIFEKSLGSHAATKSLSGIGCSFVMEGKYAEARPYLEQALTLSQRNLNVAAVGLSERQQMLMAARTRSYLDLVLSLPPPSNLSVADVFRFVLQWKGAVFSRNNYMTARDADSQMATRLVEYQTLCSRLSHLSRDLPELQAREAWRKDLEELTVKKEELEIELAARNKSFKARQELPRLTPQQLQSVLPGGNGID